MKEKVERVRVEILSPSIKGSGLNRTLDLLKGIDAHMDRIRGKMGGMADIPMTKAAVEQRIKMGQKKGTGLAPAEIGKMFDFDQRTVDRAIANYRAKIQAAAKKGKGLRMTDIFTASGEFKSAPQAATFFHKELMATQRATKTGMRGMFGGGLVPGTISPKEWAIAAAGKKAKTAPMQLQVSGNHVTASLVGPKIQLLVPGNMIEATTTGAGTRDAKSGQFTGGGGGGRRRKGGGGGGLASPGHVPGDDAELARTVSRTNKGATTSVTKAASEMETLTNTYDELNNEIGSKRTTKTGKGLVDSLKQKIALEREITKQEAALANSTGDRVENLKRGSMVKRRAADQLDALVAGDVTKKFEARKMGHVPEMVRQRAKTMRAEADRDEAMANGMLAGRRAKFDRAVTGKTVSERQFHEDMARARAEAAARDEKTLSNQERARARQRRVEEKALAASKVPPPLPPSAGGKGGKGSAMVEGFKGRAGRMIDIPGVGGGLKGLAGTFLLNTAKVALWTSSVAALYGGVAVASEALQTMLDVGLQTKRLEQVFTGVGGSAQELTSDILDLAAAENRNREEAMESAIQWSRLQLTRKQVNEAVRASLLAANVAEISAGEATEYLSSTLEAYNLEVSQLLPLLGKLNAISNRFNVTNADMLQGLSRTASIAKQAGIPIDELIGIIGGAVGTTGQSGANIGNAVKSILVALGAPEKQEFLRQQMGIEVSDGMGDIKDMSNVLAELFVRYQGLNNAQRQNLLMMIANKTQASRLAAVLDSYVTGQVLAINAQLDMNSAEEENMKIKSSLKSMIAGVKTEYDGLVVSLTNMVGMESGLADVTKTMMLALKGGKALIEAAPLLISAGPIGPYLPEGKVKRFLRESGKRRIQDTLAGGPVTAGLVRLNAALYDKVSGPGVDTVAAGQVDMAAGRVNAGRQSVRLLGNVKDVIGKKSETEQMKMIKELGELQIFGDSEAFQAELVKSMEAGTLPQTLDDLVSVLHAKEADNIKAFEAAVATRRSEIEREIAAAYVKKDEGLATTWQREMEDLNAKAAEMTHQFQMTEGALERMQAATLRTMSNLAKQKEIVEGIAAIYGGMSTDSANARRLIDVSMLREQEAALRGRIDAVNADPNMTFTQKQTELQELHRMLRDKESSRVAKESPEVTAVAQLQDNVRIARELAATQADAATSGTGRRSELENRMTALERMIEQKRRLAEQAKDEHDRINAMVQVEEHLNDLSRTRLELEKNRLMAVKEEFEFGKKMLAAGPQELLKQVVASQIVSRGGGRNPGQLLSLDESLRQAVMEMAERDQSRRPPNRPGGLRGTQRDMAGINSQLGGLDLPNFKSQFEAIEIGKAAIDLANLAKSAASAAYELGLIPQHVAELGKAVQEFRGIVNSLKPPTGHGPPQLPQAPKWY